MTRKCFFIEQLDDGQELVALTGATAHHLVSVLRVRSGDAVELRDGCGVGWYGEVVAVGHGQVQVRVTARQQLHNESPLQLTLALAFARADRMELVLRQATELGVKRFVAFRSGRSQYALSGPQLAKRQQRWLKIAREAMCQCGRMRLPEINVYSDLAEFISVADSNPREQWRCLKLLAQEREEETTLTSLQGRFGEVDELVAVVGPEGGWTEEEIGQFQSAGFHSIHLGPRVLRLETAAVAFATAAQLLWGDFGRRHG